MSYKVDFEPGWKQVNYSIEKLFVILSTNYEREGPIFTNEEYLRTHNMVVLMCTSPAPRCYDKALYERHGEIVDSICPVLCLAKLLT